MNEAVPEVEVTMAVVLIEQGAFLLDVREPDEWAAGRAPGAEFVPLGSLADQLDRIPRDRRVVAICRSGVRSLHATEYLRVNGIDAVNLVGGMRAWAAAALPVVADGDVAGTVI